MSQQSDPNPVIAARYRNTFGGFVKKDDPSVAQIDTLHADGSIVKTKVKPKGTSAPR
jgi:hypothetical protein